MKTLIDKLETFALRLSQRRQTVDSDLVYDAIARIKILEHESNGVDTVHDKIFVPMEETGPKSKQKDDEK